MNSSQFRNKFYIIRDGQGRAVHIRAKYGEVPPYVLSCGSPERTAE